MLNWVSNIFHEFIYFFKISLKIWQFYPFSPLVFVLVGGLFPLNFLLTIFLVSLKSLHLFRKLVIFPPFSFVASFSFNNSASSSGSFARVLVISKELLPLLLLSGWLYYCTIRVLLIYMATVVNSMFQTCNCRRCPISPPTSFYSDHRTQKRRDLHHLSFFCQQL